MDKDFEALGYNLRSSELEEVAQKLKWLEEVMDQIDDESETVHYNSADLSGWVESLLNELNPDPIPHPAPTPSSLDHDSTTFIPPNITSNSNNASSSRDQKCPVVVYDSHENGIQLVQALMACATVVQQNNIGLMKCHFIQLVHCFSWSRLGNIIPKPQHTTGWIFNVRNDIIGESSADQCLQLRID